MRSARSRVHTAVGSEEGYLLRVAELVVLGFSTPSFAVRVFDLGHDGIDGLVGLNFLSERCQSYWTAISHICAPWAGVAVQVTP
jgi:hypothetical protein